MPSAYEGVGERLDALLKATTRQHTPHTHERESLPMAETRVLTGS